MRIEAIYRRLNTSKPALGHKVYPYLLRKLAVTKPNQVWAMDITYIPMRRGFVYLAAVVNFYSRRVLSWRLSITMDTDFCIQAVEEAIARYGRPEIFNSDQGSQFTRGAFTGLLSRNIIKISMNGTGAWRANVFVERIWKSVKYEEVYLRAYDSVPEARASIDRYLTFCNIRRPHLSQRKTPDQAYFNQPNANSGGGINLGRNPPIQHAPTAQTNRARAGSRDRRAAEMSRNREWRSEAPAILMRINGLPAKLRNNS